MFINNTSGERWKRKFTCGCINWIGIAEFCVARAHVLVWELVFRLRNILIDILIHLKAIWECVWLAHKTCCRLTITFITVTIFCGASPALFPMVDMWFNVIKLTLLIWLTISPITHWSSHILVFLPEIFTILENEFYGVNKFFLRL